MSGISAFNKLLHLAGIGTLASIPAFAGYKLGEKNILDQLKKRADEENIVGDYEMKKLAKEIIREEFADILIKKAVDMRMNKEAGWKLPLLGAVGLLTGGGMFGHKIGRRQTAKQLIPQLQALHKKNQMLVNQIRAMQQRSI